jgi:hypothetical protein
VSWFRSLLPELRWGAGPKGIAFYTYFLDHVIRVSEVQRQRELAAELEPHFERDIAPFFDEGRIPGDTTSRGFCWSIGDQPPEPLCELCEPTMIAWTAALGRFDRLVDDLTGGRRTAVGTYAENGQRRKLAAAEWHVGGRHTLDVYTGSIIERSGNASVPWTTRWRAIEVLAPAPKRVMARPAKTGRVDWNDLLSVLVDERDNRPGGLPPETGFQEHVEALALDRYNATTVNEGELRRIRPHLYEGASVEELKRILRRTGRR